MLLLFLFLRATLLQYFHLQDVFLRSAGYVRTAETPSQIINIINTTFYVGQFIFFRQVTILKAQQRNSINCGQNNCLTMCRSIHQSGTQLLVFSVDLLDLEQFKYWGEKRAFRKKMNSIETWVGGRMAKHNYQ